MKKEIICHVSTNEEGETVTVRRVLSDPKYYLFSIGENRMVLNINELMEAIETIHQYSNIFDVEESRKLAALKAKEKEPTTTPVVVNTNGNSEIVFDLPARTEPTESELELIKQMENL